MKAPEGKPSGAFLFEEKFRFITKISLTNFVEYAKILIRMGELRPNEDFGWFSPKNRPK